METKRHSNLFVAFSIYRILLVAIAAAFATVAARSQSVQVRGKTENIAIPFYFKWQNHWVILNGTMFGNPNQNLKFERPAFNVSRQNPSHVFHCPQRQWFYAADLFSITEWTHVSLRGRRSLTLINLFALSMSVHVSFSAICWGMLGSILSCDVLPWVNARRNFTTGAPATDSDFDFLLLWHLMEWIFPSPLCSAVESKSDISVVDVLAGHGMKYSCGACCVAYCRVYLKINVDIYAMSPIRQFWSRFATNP